MFYKIEEDNLHFTAFYGSIHSVINELLRVFICCFLTAAVSFDHQMAPFHNTRTSVINVACSVHESN